VILIGNLTRDPQLRTIPSGNSVCEMGLAVNRKFKGQDGTEREEATFVDLTAWGKTGDVMNQYLRKGAAVMVCGRLKYDQWEAEGAKRSKLTVVVESFQFIGGKKEGDFEDANPGSAPRPQRQPMPGRKVEAPAGKPYGDEQHFGEDDVPF